MVIANHAGCMVNVAGVMRHEATAGVVGFVTAPKCLHFHIQSVVSNTASGKCTAYRRLLALEVPHSVTECPRVIRYYLLQ
jgi:hypothetical protein